MSAKSSSLHSFDFWASSCSCSFRSFSAVSNFFTSSSPFSIHIRKVLITHCAKSAPSTPAKHPSRIDTTAIFVLCSPSSFLARISSSIRLISDSVISLPLVCCFISFCVL
nr:MAG TPA: hypothetical protein [Caudoviricetes sp.]